MNTRRIAITAVVALVVAGGALLWLFRTGQVERYQSAQEAGAPIATPTPSSAARPAQPPPPPPDAPDAPGLPALFPGGREYPVSDMSMDQYFSRYPPTAVVDVETRKLRPDVVADIVESLGGHQVTWEGYVRRINDLPSGRVNLVVARQPGPGLDAAMVRFSAAWRDHIHGYRVGDPVRVVAVFDEVVSVFPALRGMSVEPMPAGG